MEEATDEATLECTLEAIEECELLTEEDRLEAIDEVLELTEEAELPTDDAELRLEVELFVELTEELPEPALERLDDALELLLLELFASWWQLPSLIQRWKSSDESSKSLFQKRKMKRKMEPKRCFFPLLWSLRKSRKSSWQSFLWNLLEDEPELAAPPIDVEELLLERDELLLDNEDPLWDESDD